MSFSFSIFFDISPFFSSPFKLKEEGVLQGKIGLNQGTKRGKWALFTTMISRQKETLRWSPCSLPQRWQGREISQWLCPLFERKPEKKDCDMVRPTELRRVTFLFWVLGICWSMVERIGEGKRSGEFLGRQGSLEEGEEENAVRVWLRERDHPRGV